MTNKELKLCPCGKRPEKLIIGLGQNITTATGDCCDDWLVLFRSEYQSRDSDLTQQLAVEAWNEVSRAEALKEYSWEIIRDELMRAICEFPGTPRFEAAINGNYEELYECISDHLEHDD